MESENCSEIKGKSETGGKCIICGMDAPGGGGGGDYGNASALRPLGNQRNSRH